MTPIERIEAISKKMGYRSLRAFANKLNINPQNFYDIRYGKCRISKEIAEKIKSNYQDINIRWITDGEGNMLNGDAQDTSDDVKALRDIINTQRELIDSLKEQLSLCKMLLENKSNS